MSRFQAQTNAVLDHELDDLRERLGLTRSQKADLLRELTAIASWVIRQSEAGRQVAARDGSQFELLGLPVLERLRKKQDRAGWVAIKLSDLELGRLSRALDQGFTPTPALRRALANLSDPKRRPPKLSFDSSSPMRSMARRSRFTGGSGSSAFPTDLPAVWRSIWRRSCDLDDES